MSHFRGIGVSNKPAKNTIKLGWAYVNQAAIATAYNIPRTNISRILSGERRPSIEVAEKMAEALDMDLEQFIAHLREHHSARNPQKIAA